MAVEEVLQRIGQGRAKAVEEFHSKTLTAVLTAQATLCREKYRESWWISWQDIANLRKHPYVIGMAGEENETPVHLTDEYLAVDNITS